MPEDSNDLDADFLQLGDIAQRFFNRQDISQAAKLRGLMSARELFDHLASLLAMAIATDQEGEVQIVRTGATPDMSEAELGELADLPLTGDEAEAEAIRRAKEMLR